MSWVRDGLPVRAKRPYQFDPDEVQDWLISTGKAATDEPSQVIHKTRVAIAQALGVAPRTISDWAKDPTFPGRMGEALNGDGYFPETEIREWIAAKNGDSGGAATPLHAVRIRQAAARAALDELKLQERQKQLVEIETVVSELSRAVTLARQKLTVLPDVLIRLLPEEMPDAVKGEYRSRVERAVYDACESIASSLEQEATDT